MDSTAQSQDSTQTASPIITDQLAQKLQQLQVQTQQEERAKVENIRAQQQIKATQVSPHLARLQTLLGQQPTTSTDDTMQTSQIQNNKDKERLDQFTGTQTLERVPIREIKVDYEPTQELQEWVKPIPDPQTITLPKPITDDYGAILVQATTLPKPKIELPITEETMEKALHHKIIDSIRWLAEWCRRVVMIAPDRTQYSKPSQ